MFSRTIGQDTSAKSSVSVIKGPSLNFTEDELFIMEDIHSKFEVAWLEKFIMMNRGVWWRYNQDLSQGYGTSFRS